MINKASFKQTGDIDPDTFGGHRDTLWFQLVNVPGNTTTAMAPLGSPAGHNHFQMTRAGSVIGVTYRTTAVLSAGTAELNIKVENSDTGFGLSLTTSSAVAVVATQAKDTDAFTSTQRVQVDMVTDGSFAPTTMDIMVGVEIEY